MTAICGLCYYALGDIIIFEENTMVTIHPEYIVDEDKHIKAVLLPISEWEQVMNELEELDDIRAYDDVKASPQDSISFEQAIYEVREGYGA